MAPYDRICITAAWMEIPAPLIEKLKGGGKLVAPLKEYGAM
jgi:protein-L-isoaspartate O-methyltransferase